MLYNNVNIRVTRQEKKIRKLKSMWQQPKENQNQNFEGPVLFFYFIFLSSLIPFFMILSNQITKRNKVSLAENFQRKGKKLLYHSSKDFILNILHMYKNFNPKAKKQLNISSIQNDTSRQIKEQNCNFGKDFILFNPKHFLRTL